ncbi:DUF1697 domain-containing protein [Rhodococcus sp. NPDC058521]|uniref:DUF1697 domain-containing protein n=1 Tax=Rhodococcus sp. NPDC058521 TaxID=3346536 RepID=UPI0036659B08
MTRYTALLRGINVGGINIKMADLRNVFSELGFTEVRTVLASGNVLFEAAASDTRQLKATIEHALSERFGYDAWVFVFELSVIREVVAAYPFDPDREGWHAYVVFVDGSEPLATLLEGAENLDPASERVQLGDGVVYWEVERGHTLSSRFGKASGKAKFKAVTTTRNIRTLQKLLK